MSPAYTFRPALRENVNLLICLAGPSGGGKTYTAMRLAKGITPVGQRFAVIDTEAGRAKHYADQFSFDHCDLHPPFRPTAYLDAIKAAEAASYAAIVVDSFSHEHAGEGGILDWQEEELAAMVARVMKRDPHAEEWKLRESYKMAAWIKPKMAHKAMVQRLLQVRAHLILCFRAEEKVDMVKNPQTQKMEIVPKQTLSGFKGWIPICSKDLPFELTASFILTPDKPGVPQPIKLQEQHRAIFPAGVPIDEEAGKRLAAWARGGAAASGAAPGSSAPAPTAVPASKTPETDRGSITPREPVRTESAPAAGAGAPAADRATSKEPSKPADEAGQGPSAQDLLPAGEPPKKKDEPKGPPVPGIDVEDEDQAIVKLIEAEKAKLEKQPSDAIWAKLCQGVAGTAVLDMADPAALQDLLALVKKLVAKDPDAIATARRHVRPATETAESAALTSSFPIGWSA